jgi:hypothetical protein
MIPITLVFSKDSSGKQVASTYLFLFLNHDSSVSKGAHSTGLKAALRLDDNTLFPELEHNVKISEVSMSSVIATTLEKGGVAAVTLAKKWGTGIEAATRLVTTQRGVKRMIHPSITKWFKTNDLQQRYRRLPGTGFTDTMFSNTNSRVGNKAKKVLCTADGWTRGFPMRK